MEKIKKKIMKERPDKNLLLRKLLFIRTKTRIIAYTTAYFNLDYNFTVIVINVRGVCFNIRGDRVATVREIK